MENKCYDNGGICIRKMSVLFMILLLCTACNTRELSFERIYPDRTSVNEVKENRQKQIEKESYRGDFPELYGRNVTPNYISFTYLYEQNNERVIAKYIERPTQFCWRPKIEGCSHMSPVNLFDKNTYHVVVREDLMHEIAVPIGTYMELDLYNPDKPIPLPDEAKFHYMMPNGSLVDAEFSEISPYRYKIKAPEELGKHFFIIETNYSKRIGGIAYYAFELIAK